jgi:hypothetical protein
VEACYPQMAEFLRRKLEHDPQERFQSEWYRHHRRMFGESGVPRVREASAPLEA